MEKALYVEEETPANQLSGFTKSFQRRSKEKKVEDKNVLELLSLKRENKLSLGSRITEKGFKSGSVKKVFAASNCEEMTLRKIKHYAKLAGVEVVDLDLDNQELGEKLGKPFLISMACVRE